MSLDDYVNAKVDSIARWTNDGLRDAVVLAMKEAMRDQRHACAEAVMTLEAGQWILYDNERASTASRNERRAKGHRMNIPTCVVCESEQEVSETNLGALTLPFCRVCVETGRAERFKEHELAEALAEDPGLVKVEGGWEERNGN